MVFPTTGEKDDFVRGDNVSLGSNWDEGDILNGDNFEIIGNSCRNDGGDNSQASASWNVETFGPDSEAFGFLGTIPAENGDRYTICCRLVQLGDTTVDGYGLSLRFQGSTNRMRIMRIDDGGDTDIGAEAGVTFNIGDGFGIEAIGSGVDNLKGYRHDGASWGSALITRSDANHTAAGRIGLTNFEDKDGDQPQVTSFGGGTVVAAGGGIQSLIKGGILTKGGILVGGRLAA